MKLKIGCALSVASLFVAPSLFAQLGTGSLNIDAPNYDNGQNQAGPYLVSGLTVSSGFTPASSFQTFCIGSQVDYGSPGSYNYQISTTVQPSGVVGGPGWVTLGTAYLYSQFLAGDYGYGGNTTTVDNNVADETVNAGLQLAIWTLQGQTDAGISFGSLNVSTIQADASMFETYADNEFGANVGKNANGAFGIYALNMYTGTSSDPAYAQPELVRVVPEPSTVFAGASLLLPLGLSAFRAMKRRKA